jgi:hypothetical protein
MGGVTAGISGALAFGADCCSSSSSCVSILLGETSSTLAYKRERGAILGVWGGRLGAGVVEVLACGNLDATAWRSDWLKGWIFWPTERVFGALVCWAWAGVLGVGKTILSVSPHWTGLFLRLNWPATLKDAIWLLIFPAKRCTISGFKAPISGFQLVASCTI